MKQQTILLLLLMVGLSSATIEFKVGDTINVKAPFTIDGVLTSGANCTFYLYTELQTIRESENMTDNGNGWYNYTIGDFSFANGTFYTGIVYCTYNGISGYSYFDYWLVTQTEDEWFNGLNQTVGSQDAKLFDINSSIANITSSLSGIYDVILKGNNILADINQTIEQQNDKLNNINQTLINSQNIQNQTLQAIQELNTSNQEQITLLSTANRVISIISQRMSSMLEYDMKADAHYRLIGTTNCTLEPDNIILDKYTIGTSYTMKGEIPSGRYCFMVTQYNPQSNQYGLWSNPKWLNINNTI